MSRSAAQQFENRASSQWSELDITWHIGVDPSDFIDHCRGPGLPRQADHEQFGIHHVPRFVRRFSDVPPEWTNHRDRHSESDLLGDLALHRLDGGLTSVDLAGPAA